MPANVSAIRLTKNDEPVGTVSTEGHAMVITYVVRDSDTQSLSCTCGFHAQGSPVEPLDTFPGLDEVHRGLLAAAEERARDLAQG